MKLALVFLLVATLGITAINSAPQKRDVSSESTSTPDLAETMTDFAAAFKHIMPCGDPAMDIPPYAPFRLPIISLDINQELLILNGSIKNMVLSGLSEFIIIELSTNATNNRTSFDVLYKDIQLLGEYNLYVNADLAGYKFIVNLVGLMNLQVLDLRLNGGITFGTNAVGGMLLSDVDYYVQVGDIISHVLDTQWSVALNDFFNKYVHDTAMIWLQTNRDFLNEVLSGYITETVNAAVYNVTLSEFTQGMEEWGEEWNAITCTV